MTDLRDTAKPAAGAGDGRAGGLLKRFSAIPTPLIFAFSNGERLQVDAPMIAAGTEGPHAKK